MNDLIIKVSKRSRLIDLDHSTLGIVGENLQEKLIFTFQDEFIDGMARLEYELDSEKHYVLMDKVGQSYILPVQNVLLSKEGNIDLQLVVTQDETGTPVFKSEVFTLYCKKSIEAVGEAPSSYELWIEKANRILLEASRVNIDGKKTGNETIITITQRDGNKKSFPILDGKDGADGQDGNGIVSIEKTSTSGLVDTYTITFTDGTTTTYTVTNGETPDLSDYVKNTDYATQSKAGIVKGSNAYAVGFDGANIRSVTNTYEQYQSRADTMFVSKGTLENVITGKQLINQTTLEDSQAEQDERTLELQAELDRYKLLENALPHTENETASDYVTLTNTAKSPMEIETIPQTSQETTTGKNLLNIDNSEEGGIDTSGTEVSGDTLWRGNEFIKVLPNTAYTFSSNKSMTLRLYQYDENYTFIPPREEVRNNTFLTITTGSSTQYLKFSIYDNGTHFTKNLVKTYNLQIEQSSTVTSYEPYTGGIPSPNPDYPQEIHCTTGENEIKVVGKNLFDESQLLEATEWALNSNGYYYGLISNYFAKFRYGFTFANSFKDNTQYTIKAKAYCTSGSPRIKINYTDNTNSTINLSGSAPTDYSFTTPQGKTISTIVADFGTGGNETLYLKDLMLNEGSTESSYLPYEETTYPISLGNKEMFNINGVYDGFVYDENEDKFYINRKIGKVVLDGSESWFYNSSNEIFVLNKGPVFPQRTTIIPFSNYFIGQTSSSFLQVLDKHISLQSNDTADSQRFLIKFLDVGSTVGNLQQWLLNHNTIVIYPLATSTLEEITDTTLISQLRAIKNALSMQGTTHIISTASGSNLPFLIKARAVQTIERT